MIKVQNIYYMLAYAYQTLNSQEEKKYDSEKFDYAEDLFAVILANGISRQFQNLFLKIHQHLLLHLIF